MARDKFGFWLFVAATALCLILAVLVTYVFRIEWFSERILSADRWTRAQGMLPIAFPIYMLAGMVFSYYRR